MIDVIVKEHNKTNLLNHFVFPVKYRRDVFSDRVEQEFRRVCLDIQWRYEINFDEIGFDWNHVHMIVQLIPTMCVSRAVTIIKSITANQLFKVCWEELRKQLWWWHLRTGWYYANSVWIYAWLQTLRNYIANQWLNKECKVRMIYKDNKHNNYLQQWLFDMNNN